MYEDPLRTKSKLTDRIATDNRMMANIYSVSFTFVRKRNRFCAAFERLDYRNSDFEGIPKFYARIRRTP